MEKMVGTLPSINIGSPNLTFQLGIGGLMKRDVFKFWQILDVTRVKLWCVLLTKLQKVSTRTISMVIHVTAPNEISELLIVRRTWRIVENLKPVTILPI